MRFFFFSCLFLLFRYRCLPMFRSFSSFHGMFMAGIADLLLKCLLLRHVASCCTKNGAIFVHLFRVPVLLLGHFAPRIPHDLEIIALQRRARTSPPWRRTTRCAQNSGPQLYWLPCVHAHRSAMIVSDAPRAKQTLSFKPCRRSARSPPTPRRRARRVRLSAVMSAVTLILKCLRVHRFVDFLAGFCT